jgi:hypothetical protein
MQRERVLHKEEGIAIGTASNVNGISWLKNMGKYISVWHKRFSRLWLCKVICVTSEVLTSGDTK